jgi:hypothetical protein
VQKGRPGARRTRKRVGICGLAPRISAIVTPYRGGSTKARQAAGTAAFTPRKPLGDRQFRAFAVREAMVLTGGCDSKRPARRFAFSRLKERIQDLDPEIALLALEMDRN